MIPSLSFFLGETGSRLREANSIERRLRADGKNQANIGEAGGGEVVQAAVEHLH